MKQSLVLVLCCVVGVRSQPFEISECELTILNTSTRGLDRLEEYTGRWRIGEVPFRDCDGNAVEPSEVSSEASCLSIDNIEALIDQNKSTDFECTPAGNNHDISSRLKFSFTPSVILGGYDIISKSDSQYGASNDYPTQFKMECYEEGKIDPVLIDDAYELTPFTPATDTTEIKKRYTTFSTGDDNDKFLGSFDEEDLQCPSEEEEAGGGDGTAARENGSGGFGSTTGSNVGGDPFVMVDGEAIQFWLPVGVWTEVLSSTKLKVLCRSFGRPGTTEQWLDGLRIVDVSGDVYTGKDLLQVEIPRDIPLGSLAANADSDLSFLRIFIDDAPVEHTSRDQLSSMNNLVSVHVGKMSKTIMGLSGDGLWVHTPDFGFSIFTSAAAKFDTAADNDAFAHINFKFTDLPRDHNLAGFFVETIHGTKMSDTTKDMLLRPQSPYAMDSDFM